MSPFSIFFSFLLFVYCDIICQGRLWVQVAVIACVIGVAVLGVAYEAPLFVLACTLLAIILFVVAFFYSLEQADNASERMHEEEMNDDL